MGFSLPPPRLRAFPIVRHRGHHNLQPGRCRESGRGRSQVTAPSHQSAHASGFPGKHETRASREACGLRLVIQTLQSCQHSPLLHPSPESREHRAQLPTLTGDGSQLSVSRAFRAAGGGLAWRRAGSIVSFRLLSASSCSHNAPPPSPLPQPASFSLPSPSHSVPRGRTLHPPPPPSLVCHVTCPSTLPNTSTP